MKQIQRSLALLALVCGLFAATAHAQSTTLRFRVDVPFEFTVGAQTLPAGQYSIVSITPDILSVRDDRERVLVTMIASHAESLKTYATPTLTFRLDGDRHVLEQVWDAGSNGFEVSRHKSLPAMAQVATQQPMRRQ